MGEQAFCNVIKWKMLVLHFLPPGLDEMNEKIFTTFLPAVKHNHLANWCAAWYKT